MLEVEIAEMVFEPRVGGRVYDRGIDGSEYQWARVLAGQAPDHKSHILGSTYGWTVVSIEVAGASVGD